MFLQRTVGNQAVERLIKSGALQDKLRIGKPGDKYEQEADRVSDARATGAASIGTGGRRRNASSQTENGQRPEHTPI